MPLDLTPYLKDLPSRPIQLDLTDPTLSLGHTIWARVPGRSIIVSGVVTAMMAQQGIVRIRIPEGRSVCLDRKKYVILTARFLERWLGCTLDPEFFPETAAPAAKRDFLGTLEELEVVPTTHALPPRISTDLTDSSPHVAVTGPSRDPFQNDLL